MVLGGMRAFAQWRGEEPPRPPPWRLGGQQVIAASWGERIDPRNLAADQQVEAPGREGRDDQEPRGHRGEGSHGSEEGQT